MTSDRDEVCGCPVAAYTPNRVDRRAMARAGRRAPLVTLHQPSCVRAGRGWPPQRRAIAKIRRRRR